MARPSRKIILTDEQQQILESFAKKRETPHSLVQRSQLILHAAAGMNNCAIGKVIGLSDENVSVWRKRWFEYSQVLQTLTGEPLRKAIIQHLADRPRSGMPPIFDAEQISQIIALACETPPEPLTHWTAKDLAHEAVKRGIVETISTSSIERFLKSSRLKTASDSVLATSHGR